LFVQNTASMLGAVTVWGPLYAQSNALAPHNTQTYYADETNGVLQW